MTDKTKSNGATWAVLGQGDGIPRSCSTCEHRTMENGMRTCMRSGYLCIVERKYPDYCGANFEGWSPRLGFMQRMKAIIFGYSTKDQDDVT